MEQDSNSFEILLENNIETNFKKIFPLAQKCLVSSNNDIEVLRAIRIIFKFGSKLFCIDEMETEIFQQSCPAVKKILLRNLNLLENLKNNSRTKESTSYCSLIKNCTEIITYLTEFCLQLKNFELTSVLQVENFIINTADLLYMCFCHFNTSENVYGTHFKSLTEYLTCFFKKCCELLEFLLIFLSDKLVLKFDNTRESEVLVEILNLFSKSGILLMNLDVKTMAKVWKTYVSLLEKHFPYLKEELHIEDIINSLCESISSSAECAVLGYVDATEFDKIIKLACFNLKLVIKFCEICHGCLIKCQKSLLNLIFKLLWCDLCILEADQQASIINKDLLRQLTVGTESLFSQLISDNELIRECYEFCQNIEQLTCQKNKSSVLCMFCCFVLKKLMHQDSNTRNLWFNENYNILQWLFLCIWHDPFDYCLKKQLSNILVLGKQRKFLDFYQYALVSASSFVLTSTTIEFKLIEKTLIKNILQPNILGALLAIDIWCLLARFADSELCLTQIFNLCKILQEFRSDTLRVEKWYLMFLIYRLFPLLTPSQKVSLSDSFQELFYFEFWKGKNFDSNDFQLYLMEGTNNLFVNEIRKLVLDERKDIYFSGNGKEGMKKFDRHIVKFWEFNEDLLAKCYYKEIFLKTICLLTSYAVPYLSSEDLLLILSKVRHLLVNQSNSTQLHITRVLHALSSKIFAFDSLQQHIITKLAEIFRMLLLSNNVFVKQKTLEAFYTFSHVTNHPEIIAFSVQNSTDVKMDVTNYFQKKITNPDTAKLFFNKYITILSKAQFQHICQSRNCSHKTLDFMVKQNEKQLSCDLNIHEVIDKWKIENEILIQNIHHLTNSQKELLKNICLTLINALK